MAMTEEAVAVSRTAEASPVAAPEDVSSPRGYDYGLDVDEETMQRAESFAAEYAQRLRDWTEAHPHRVAEWEMRMETAGLIDIQAGEPTLPGGYQYWNTLTVGPIQFFGNPPYRPGKIIAGGELALFLGVIWINPANSPGGGIPGTVALGSRDYTACFETINLSSVANGPDFSVMATFAGPAPIVTVIPWFLLPPDPGPKPAIFETHFAVDVAQPGQPFASLATWHIDTDFEPGFLGLPPQGPQAQHDIPSRYLVYRRA